MYHIETHFNLVPNSKGFSVVEGLVALAILAITAFFAMPAIHNSYQMVNNFERKGKCEGFFNSATNAIELTPPEYRTSDVHNGYWQAKINSTPTITDPSKDFAFLIPDDPTIKARFTKLEVTKLYDYAGSSTVFGLSGTGTGFPVLNNGVVLYTPLLLSGPMGYLADLYNTGYCDDFKEAPEFVANAVLGVGTNKVTNTKLLMKVQRQNLQDQSIAGDCSKFWPRPRNNLNQDVIKEPYSNFNIAKYPTANWIRSDSGFQVTFRAEISAANTSEAAVCESTRSFNLPTDFHNVMDYFLDMNAVRKADASALPGGDPFMDITIDYNKDASIRGRNAPGLVVNKTSLYADTNVKLNTVLSNARIIANTLNYDRPECSQDGTTAANTVKMNFTLALEVANLSKEPGVIAMCNDTSKNHSDRAPDGSMSSYAWCQKGASPTPGATVNIVVDKDTIPKSQGWVPCEAMTLCGQKPIQTRVVRTSDQSLRYEYDYSISNDRNNSATPNRLWGCELKYGVALVDPSGNLSYVPNKPATDKNRADFLTTGGITIAPSFMREVNPKVYFQPPPCYLCTCKRCKSSKGLFGGFFNFFLLAILTIATGGLIWAAVPMVFPVVTGLAAAACLTGNMGCSGDSSYRAPDFNSADFLDCKDQSGAGSISPCSCGQTCRKEVPKGKPRWRDMDLINASLTGVTIPKACDPVDKQIVTAGGTFWAKLAYRYDGGVVGGKIEYLDVPVEHGDYVSWQQYNSSTGLYCYAFHMCQDGNFVVSQEPYENSSGATVLASQVGCFKVKTAHKILWDSKSDGKKPDRGASECLEIEFGLGPQNPSGGTLWGYADTEYECGNDTANESIPPTFDTSSPLKRFIGRSVAGQCPDTFSVTVPTVGTFTKTPAAALPIYDYSLCSGDGGGDGGGGGGGANYNYFSRKGKLALIDQLLVNAGFAAPVGSACGFACWAACVPPTYAPSNPLLGTEMKYYEASTTTEISSLKFCSDYLNDNTTLDSIYTPAPK